MSKGNLPRGREKHTMKKKKKNGAVNARLKGGKEKKKNFQSAAGHEGRGEKA